MIDGGDGRDLLISGSGVDFVDGGLGLGTILGEGGGDVMYGGLDADGMGGCSGNDMVKGEGGNDTLWGGPVPIRSSAVRGAIQ